MSMPRWDKTIPFSAEVTQRVPGSPHASFGRAYYSASISDFQAHSNEEVLAALATNSTFAIETTQRDAWLTQTKIVRDMLKDCRVPGLIAFEFNIPRVGRRIDVLALIGHVVFVIEFKVGEKRFSADAIEQVWDYALDLKNFHSTSHDKQIVPVLVATQAIASTTTIALSPDHDGVLRPIMATPEQLPSVIRGALDFCEVQSIDPAEWATGRYTPTPTIVEAAMALYGGHGVEEISRSDATATNLSLTSDSVARIVREAQAQRRKSICFVTGVPGAGKTLVGLNIATQHIDKNSELYSVFLSGNGPLVMVLCEALARDKARRLRDQNQRARLGEIRSEVKAFVQNVHHFRDECLRDGSRPPIEHVALFDEAQRAWNAEQTASFMLRKKNTANFEMSEPQFLISCMDRHKDWAVVVCLVGGGQEINTGEAGIGEWIRAVRTSFPHWHVHLSPRLTDSEYESGQALAMLEAHQGVHIDQSLHLSVSMRSFRAEHVSSLVKAVLDLDRPRAKAMLAETRERYPIVITRSLDTAKAWLKAQARGTERFGLVVSSQAQRLKPHAIDVRVPVNPVHWFLHPREDVRSSFYLEDAATEFHVQGLELDWACVVWDADFRYTEFGWRHWSFRGDKWQKINAVQRQAYLKNAYRVLLTRARQGMVIVVPTGSHEDPTRSPGHYDATYDYLCGLGFERLA